MNANNCAYGLTPDLDPLRKAVEEYQAEVGPSYIRKNFVDIVLEFIHGDRHQRDLVGRAARLS